MKPEYFDQNLTEKYRTDRGLKWDDNYSVLFYFIN